MWFIVLVALLIIIGLVVYVWYASRSVSRASTISRLSRAQAEEDLATLNLVSATARLKEAQETAERLDKETSELSSQMSTLQQENVTLGGNKTDTYLDYYDRAKTFLDSLPQDLIDVLEAQYGLGLAPSCTTEIPSCPHEYHTYLSALLNALKLYIKDQTIAVDELREKVLKCKEKVASLTATYNNQLDSIDTEQDNLDKLVSLYQTSQSGPQTEIMKTWDDVGPLVTRLKDLDPNV